jgi:hypothetical protein
VGTSLTVTPFIRNIIATRSVRTLGYPKAAAPVRSLELLYFKMTLGRNQMRQAGLFFSLVSISLLIAAPASALKVQTTSYGSVTQVCGSSGQSGNGHYGCSKPCGKTMCDYDCKMNQVYGAIKCTKTTIIKPTGGKNGKGSIQTGGVKGASGGNSGAPIHHPINVGVENPPTKVKSDPSSPEYRGGGPNQTGEHHR